MRTRQWLLPLLMLAIGIAGACDDDPTGPATRFRATLRGTEETPPVTTNATGSATFELRRDTVFFTLTATGLADVTAAHIHGPAGVGTPAGVIVGLFNAQTEGTWTGTKSGFFTAANLVSTQEVLTLDALLQLMRTSQAYVNVHSTAHPGGEIRGQIVRR